VDSGIDAASRAAITLFALLALLRARRGAAEERPHSML
jgi:hypothetical protein